MQNRTDAVLELRRHLRNELSALGDTPAQHLSIFVRHPCLRKEPPCVAGSVIEFRDAAGNRPGSTSNSYAEVGVESPAMMLGFRGENKHYTCSGAGENTTVR